jgi:hypothetical protein
MEKIIESMLTTVDNPYNPFENFEDWYRYDRDHEHYCCERLAEVVGDLKDSNPVEEVKITESAINYIVANDVLGKYAKVQRVCEIE